MSVKYQVFVSSTYDDLRREREQVVKAILEMGHIPVGMEMFSAADEQQWQIISRHVESSDYYVVIVAHRYGSMERDRSYTEKEYDYAIECGIPVLGFVIDESAAWQPAKFEKDQVKRDALGRFKEKVKSKYISYWSSAPDLYGKVSIALNKQITVHPRTGWVRPDQAVGPEVVAELARLSKENAELRSKLDELLQDGKRQGTTLWMDFIDRAYDYNSAIAWFDATRRGGKLGAEASRAEDNLGEKLAELDKLLIKAEFTFLGSDQEHILGRANALFHKIHNRQAKSGDIMQFARSVGSMLRRSSNKPAQLPAAADR